MFFSLGIHMLNRISILIGVVGGAIGLYFTLVQAKEVRLIVPAITGTGTEMLTTTIVFSNLGDVPATITEVGMYLTRHLPADEECTGERIASQLFDVGTGAQGLNLDASEQRAVDFNLETSISGEQRVTLCADIEVTSGTTTERTERLPIFEASTIWGEFDGQDLDKEPHILLKGRTVRPF